jgi:MoxR-like ATPase
MNAPSTQHATGDSPAVLREALAGCGYFADETLASLGWLAAHLERPILLEGEAGVGKTSFASALARVLNRPLIRLQCFEGLDLADAAYEWNIARQLLSVKIRPEMHEQSLYTEDYLLPKPLLSSITHPQGTVLLIDEIDRADEAFEAYLLEVLSEYQMSIPELGTLRAKVIPRVILTSNGTRALSDALRRRCLFHVLDYPDAFRERNILLSSLPEADIRLVESVVQVVQGLRKEDLIKRPGIAESLDWLRALHHCGHRELPDDLEQVRVSLGCLLKTREDQFALGPDLYRRLHERYVD